MAALESGRILGWQRLYHARTAGQMFEREVAAAMADPRAAPDSDDEDDVAGWKARACKLHWSCIAVNQSMQQATVAGGALHPGWAWPSISRVPGVVFHPMRQNNYPVNDIFSMCQQYYVCAANMVSGACHAVNNTYESAAGEHISLVS